MNKLKKLTALLLTALLIAAPFCIIDASAAGKWVTAWTTSMVNSSVSVAGLELNDVIPSGSTIRTELSVTTGGTKLRFKFSNQYGDAAYAITESFVAKSSGSGAITGNSVRITFNGKQSVTVPAGSTVWSDEITFATNTLDKISVSTYFKDMVYIKTGGLCNGKTYLNSAYLANRTSQCTSSKMTVANQIKITSSTVTYYSVPFLCEIETLSRSSSPECAVFIGDSTLVNDTYLYYAQRLAASGITDISVVNEAIVGNRLLSNCTGSLIGNLFGDSLKSRFERDVLNLKNVKYVFVKIGLNDIIHQYSSSLGPDTPSYTPDDIIAGYKSLITLCHNRGIKIYFFTKSPWNGYARAFLGSTDDLVWSQDAQDKCDEVNEWIRNNKLADGYIDCDELADPSNPTALCSSFTPDGAHLTALGSIALADLIPLSYVGVNKTGRTAADINKVDPYAEKKKILYNMQHPEETTTAEEEPATTPSTEPATQNSSEETTASGTGTTASAATTSAVQTTSAEVESYSIVINVQTTTADDGVTATEETTAYTPVYVIPSTTSVEPLSPYREETSTQAQVDVDKIGSSSGVLFILVLFLVIIIVGAVVIINVTKKKNTELDQL